MAAWDEVDSRPGRANPASMMAFGASAVAWGALWWWQESSAGSHAAHADWTQSAISGSLCLTLSEGDAAGAAGNVLLFFVHWSLMIVAMMVPAAAPAFDAWRRGLRLAENRAPILLAAVAGYLLAWMMFGLLVLLLDSVIWRVSQASPFLTFNGWVIGAVIFALAGAFQLSRTKARLLDRCSDADRLSGADRRLPLTVVRAGFAGAGHGCACVGVGWALMLLMFVFWAGSLAWMMTIGIAMMAERQQLFGVPLHRPIGCTLLIAALGTVWIHLP